MSSIEEIRDRLRAWQNGDRLAYERADCYTTDDVGRLLVEVYRLTAELVEAKRVIELQGTAQSLFAEDAFAEAVERIARVQRTMWVDCATGEYMEAILGMTRGTAAQGVAMFFGLLRAWTCEQERDAAIRERDARIPLASLPTEFVCGEWIMSGQAEPDAVVTYASEPSPETGHVGWCWWARGKMGEARDYVAAREAAEKSIRAHATSDDAAARFRSRADRCDPVEVPVLAAGVDAPCIVCHLPDGQHRMSCYQRDRDSRAAVDAPRVDAGCEECGGGFSWSAHRCPACHGTGRVEGGK